MKSIIQRKHRVKKFECEVILKIDIASYDKLKGLEEAKKWIKKNVDTMLNASETSTRLPMASVVTREDAQFVFRASNPVLSE